MISKYRYECMKEYILSLNGDIEIAKHIHNYICISYLKENLNAWGIDPDGLFSILNRFKCKMYGMFCYAAYRSKIITPYFYWCNCDRYNDQLALIKIVSDNFQGGNIVDALHDLFPHKDFRFLAEPNCIVVLRVGGPYDTLPVVIINDSNNKGFIRDAINLYFDGTSFIAGNIDQSMKTEISAKSVLDEFSFNINNVTFDEYKMHMNNNRENFDILKHQPLTRILHAELHDDILKYKYTKLHKILDEQIKATIYNYLKNLGYSDDLSNNLYPSECQYGCDRFNYKLMEKEFDDILKNSMDKLRFATYGAELVRRLDMYIRFFGLTLIEDNKH